MRPPSSRDHPRIRGDHIGEMAQGLDNLGSPPLTRGPHFLSLATTLADGITPAYAGTTSPAPSAIGERWDHPRIRGDHIFTEVRFQFQQGSPPHTRGPPLSDLVGVQAVGITPAYAGTTGGSGSSAAR